MNKEFVPYEQALALKELGFNEPCFGYYNTDPYLGSPAFNLVKPFDHEWCLPAPLYQQCFRWFREKYDIDVVIGVAYDKGKTFYLRIETSPTSGYQYFDSKFKTYEEAELACLIKLIELVKEK